MKIAKIAMLLIALTATLSFSQSYYGTYKDSSYSTQTEKKREYNTYDNCPNGSYVNAYGNVVCRPSRNNAGGATAICRDGTYSYSQSRSGTCSRHGGVEQWL